MSEHKLTDAQSSQIKEIIRENLRALHDFCEEHNLTYYLSDGTLLGAIRHKGMIPWDDDADVCMPRKDYDRLLTLVNELPDPYILGHFSLDKNYIYPFIKFMNKNTEIIEMFGSIEYRAGVWVDIFPLDKTYKNIYLRKLHFKLTNIVRVLFELKIREYQNPDKKENKAKYKVKKVIKRMIYLTLKPLSNNLLFKIMDKLASHLQNKKSNIVGNLYTFIGINASHDKVFFKSRFLTEFDGHKLYAPIGYDKYLSNLYGDYMTPPPSSERQTHNIKIVTLSENRGCQNNFK